MQIKFSGLQSLVKAAWETGSISQRDTEGHSYLCGKTWKFRGLPQPPTCPVGAWAALLRLRCWVPQAQTPTTSLSSSPTRGFPQQEVQGNHTLLSSALKTSPLPRQLLPELSESFLRDPFQPASKSTYKDVEPSAGLLWSPKDLVSLLTLREGRPHHQATGMSSLPQVPAGLGQVRFPSLICIHL